MSETILLIGSLSNDLLRTANLTQRGSKRGAMRFLQEAKRWSALLQKEDVKEYIKKIARDVSNQDTQEISIKLAEKYLMYGILLQNYSLSQKRSS